MRTLYLDCSMGAAGDMIAAALLELVPDAGAAVARLNALGIPGVAYAAGRVTRCGVVGTSVEVSVDGVVEGEEDWPHPHAHDGAESHEHGQAHARDHGHAEMHDHAEMHEHAHAHGHRHASVADMTRLISALPVPDGVRDDAFAVFGLIAEAESRAHGMPVEQIHFHEVGTLDAVADVVAACLLIDELAPDRVVSSPVTVGFGQIRCAHGILPVPAPATACILEGVPIGAGAIEGEMCTPTGAALLRHFADEFAPLPVMRVARIGYGMGKRDYAGANCVRALMGEDERNGDAVVELSCNLDDMTPEDIGFAQEVLMEAGALDVCSTQISMKKGRPGIGLTCLCDPEDEGLMVGLLFGHTTTLGIRRARLERYVLERETLVGQTEFGPVRYKRSSGYGVERVKPEYEDLKVIAENRSLRMADVRARAGDRR